jgi:glycosyltransferase involved in cell wall biosynthesis
MTTSAEPRRSRPRVLQCITRLGLGGAERVALSIVQALRAEIDFGVFTVYGASHDEVGREMQRTLRDVGAPWFRGTRLPMKAGGMVPGGAALARAVATFRPDVIHYHSETPEACGATAMLLSATCRATPAVRTIHNSVFWRYWPRVGRWCDRRLARAHIACVSRAALTEFQRYRADSGVAAPADAIVIYNGVAVPRQPPHAAPRRADVRRVLFAGRFEDQKGADVLCAALPLVTLPANVRGELTFLGHGGQQALVEALARNPPRGWNVTVRGPVAALPATFSEFDVAVVPSRFEGLCLVAIEATLCGRPVVATDVPGLREALPESHPWCAAGDDPASLAGSLSTCLARTGDWAAVVSVAQDFAERHFSPAVMAAGYGRMYADAISAAAAPDSRPAS